MREVLLAQQGGFVGLGETRLYLRRQQLPDWVIPQEGAEERGGRRQVGDRVAAAAGTPNRVSPRIERGGNASARPRVTILKKRPILRGKRRSGTSLAYRRRRRVAPAAHCS